VAGQGFNLGLRDAALLAEMLAPAPDPGAGALLEEFERRRAADRRGMIDFTDGLVKLFASEGPALRCCAISASRSLTWPRAPKTRWRA